MYTYYMFAAMGPQFHKYLWWKKYITDLQMVSRRFQFSYNPIPKLSPQLLPRSRSSSAWPSCTRPSCCGRTAATRAGRSASRCRTPSSSTCCSTISTRRPTSRSGGWPPPKPKPRPRPSRRSSRPTRPGSRKPSSPKKNCNPLEHHPFPSFFLELLYQDIYGNTKPTPRISLRSVYRTFYFLSLIHKTSKNQTNNNTRIAHVLQSTHRLSTSCFCERNLVFVRTFFRSCVR